MQMANPSKTARRCTVVFHSTVSDITNIQSLELLVKDLLRIPTHRLSSWTIGHLLSTLKGESSEQSDIVPHNLI